MNISVLKLGSLVATVAGAEGVVFDQDSLDQPVAKLALLYFGAIDNPSRPYDDFWGATNPASLVWVAHIDGLPSPPFFQLDKLLFWIQTYINYREVGWECLEDG